MKKQFFLLGTAAIFAFSACNDNATETTTTNDSTAANTTATTGTGERRGTEIANFSSRTFMDVKTNKPLKLRWDAEHYYYVDESGSQPYYYYDPASKDTFDYWGRRLNGYLTYSNGDYTLDESRMPASDMSTTTDTGSSTTTGASGDLKIKATDDKYKEKTDTSKLKVTDDKLKAKKK